MTKKIALLLTLMLSAAGAWAAQTHTVKEGDTLWALAGKYCGQPFDWEKLYEANKTLVKDPHWIYPDMTLSLTACTAQAAPAALVPQAAIAEPEILPAPAAQSAAEEPQEIGVPEPELSAEEIAQAQALPPVSQDAEPVVKGQFVRMEKEHMVVSDTMPKDMTWGIPSSSAERLPPDWKQDGRVRLASLEDEDDEMAGMGEIIEVKITSGIKLKPGAYLKIYRIGVPEKDEKGKVTALLAQHSALVKVLRVDGSKVHAEIVRLFNPVEKGDAVKKL